MSADNKILVYYKDAWLFISADSILSYLGQVLFHFQLRTMLLLSTWKKRHYFRTLKDSRANISIVVCTFTTEKERA